MCTIIQLEKIIKYFFIEILDTFYSHNEYACILCTLNLMKCMCFVLKITLALLIFDIDTDNTRQKQCPCTKYEIAILSDSEYGLENALKA